MSECTEHSWFGPPERKPPARAVFGEIKEEVFDALMNIDSEGTYACSDIITDAPSPGLEVQNLGLIGLPLSIREAEILESRCHQSPFGKGEQTLVDASVRSSWELDASQFEITNPEWDDCIENIVSETYDKLGLAYGEEIIEAQPYKLLIYGKGTFFKAHQDSEKTDGMFGTLVVSLPSKHEGGKAVFMHSGGQQ